MKVARFSTKKRMKSWLEDNNIEIYSRSNEWNSVSPEIFIKTLESKVYKYMAARSENVYIEYTF